MAPEPLSIAAAVAAAAGVADRVLDVTGARKRIAALESARDEVRTTVGEIRAALALVGSDVTKLRTDLEALADRVRRRAERSDTGSQRAVMVPPPPSPDSERRIADLERRATALEEAADERARWERTIAADVARIEGHLSARMRRARERESDG